MAKPDMPKTVIVGSSDMWVSPSMVSSIVALILSTEENSIIAVRGPKRDKVKPGDEEVASSIEKAAFLLAEKTGRQPLVYRPIGDRSTVFDRDYRLVEGADMVVAYFDPANVMLGGTGHVVKAALDRQIKVEAYTVNDDGELELVGSDDPTIQSDGTGVADW